MLDRIMDWVMGAIAIILTAFLFTILAILSALVGEAALMWLADMVHTYWIPQVPTLGYMAAFGIVFTLQILIKILKTDPNEQRDK